MRVLFILLNIAIMFNSKCNSNANGLGFKELFNNVIETISYDISNFTNYTDTVIANDFDFNLFKPILGESNDSNKFVLYYQNNEIVMVKKVLKGKPFYTLTLWHTKEHIFYNAYIYGVNESATNFFAQGFFIYDKQTQTNLYVGISHEAIKLPIDIKQRAKGIKIREYTDVGAVYKIFKLDENLKATTRLNFYNNELLSFSFVKSNSNETYEEMAVYAKETCETTTQLNKIDMPTLFYLLNGDICSEGLLFNVQTNYAKDYPYWAFNELGYLVR